MDTLPTRCFVTAALRVDYVRPTPLGPELLLHGLVRSISGRKVIVGVTLSVAGETTVRGEVVAVELPESMRPASQGASPEAREHVPDS